MLAIVFIAYLLTVETVEPIDEQPIEVVLTVDEMIDKYALEYGQDPNLARRIIKAESEIYEGATNHNRRADGTIWSTDHCLWQINDYYHDKLAETMGWDYKNNVEHCIEMGFYLLKRDGSSPWTASKHRWNK